MRGIHRWLTKLLPESFRARYGSEIIEVTDRQMEAARSAGPVAMAKVSLRSAGGVVKTALQLHTRALEQDLRFAVRSLWRHPVHVGAVVGTLALGIGATTAVYGVVRAVLLRPLPYPEPEALVMLKWMGPEDADPSRASNPSIAEYVTLDGMGDVFSSVAAFSVRGRNLEGGRYAEWALTAAVSPGALETLGVTPRRGRAFTPEDEAAVILTDGLWRRAFGGDEGVIGSAVRVDGEPHTVVGVLGPGVGFLDGVLRNDFEMLQATEYDSGSMGSPSVIARLGPGLSPDDASERLAAVPRVTTAGNAPASEARLRAVPVRDLIVGASSETALWLLLGASLLVLAIAAVNVVNLRMSHAGEREREIAVRCALGAGWGQLGRLFSVEALLLAGLGAAGGLVVANGLTGVLRGMSPRSLPRMAELGLDWTAIAVAGSVALLITLALGFVPLARWWRRDIHAPLRVGSGKGPVGRSLTGNVFVVVQVTACMALFAGTALMSRSFWDMYRQDLGYESDRVLNVFFSLDPDRYGESERQLAFLQEIQERLEAEPGVTAAAAVSFPLGEGTGMAVRVAEGPVAPLEDEGVVAGRRIVSPGFFRAAGITLTAGRDFRFGDGNGDEPRYIITRDLARRLWPEGGAVGRIITPDRGETGSVIGVAEPIRPTLAAGRTIPALFTSYAQAPSRFFNLMIRTRGDPIEHFPVVRRVTADIDSRQAVHLPPTMETLDRRLAGSVADRWLVFLFVGGFSTIALVLSSLGLYGLLAGRVRRQTRDIGVRLALGAAPRDVYRVFVGQGLALTAVGIVVGAGFSFVLTRPLERFLFGVTSSDPVTLAATASFLLATATLACAIPARRAARVDPAHSMRVE